MELRVLQYFLAVAREQNISAAAHSLHLTQPTLSRQLRELEEEMCIRDRVQIPRQFYAVAIVKPHLLPRNRVPQRK